MNSSNKKFIILIIVIVVIILVIFGVRALIFNVLLENPAAYSFVALFGIMAIVIVFSVIKAKNNDSLGNSGSMDDMDFEMKKYLILMGDDKPKDPSVYQARKCPNCGAPVDPMRPNYCSFCRTKFIDTTKDPRKTPVHPDDYNPTRYYDENFTGYSINHANDQQQPGNMNSGNNGYGQNNGYSQNNGYGQNNGFNNGYGNYENDNNYDFDNNINNRYR